MIEAVGDAVTYAATSLPDFPGPWFGVALLGHLTSGVTSIVIGLAMVGIFTVRRKLVSVHSLPLFVGLVVFFLTSGIGDLLRLHVLIDAGEVGTVVWNTTQKYRLCVLVAQGVSGIWVLASLLQQWPFMRNYMSDEILQKEIETLREKMLKLHYFAETKPPKLPQESTPHEFSK
jgi:hypothetical protein